MFQYKGHFFGVLFILFFNALAFSQEKEPRVNQERLSRNLMELATFGKNAQNGSDRVAYSDHEIAARKFLMDKLVSMGLTVSIDYAGNILAQRKGKNPKLKPLALGSHIDAVPNGGFYDGNVGVMGGIEVLETLNDFNLTTEHPLELFIFTNEEGGVFGSRAIAGKIDESALKVKTASGYTNAEGVKRIGGIPEKIMEVKRPKGSLHAFLELHIEQGNNLNQTGTAIGVVEGIVGLKWWDVTVSGFTNHAGTTPMKGRKDALLAAAEFVLMVNQVATSTPGTQVGTVGRIKAFPGAPNVIPGKVVMSLELRDLKSAKIASLYEEITQKAQHIAEKTGTSFAFSPIDATADPALMDKNIQALIQKSADQLGLSHMTLPSGAGHDAQDMALITPTGMIFVPSIDGISHSPKEFSTPKAIADGANVLLKTLLALDTTELK